MKQQNLEKFGVIFDMDGVLVHSLEAHLRAFQKMGETLGKAFTRELLEQTSGMHNSQIFPLWLERSIDPIELKTMAEKKEALYRTMVPEHVRPLPGVVDLIRNLRTQGVKLAVGSSGPRKNVELILRTLEIAPEFTVVVTGDDIRCGKPDPEVFLKAGSGLGLHPSQCLVIEDAIQGVKAAKAAGMSVIAITSSTPRERLQEANLVIDSMTEIDAALIYDTIKG